MDNAEPATYPFTYSPAPIEEQREGWVNVAHHGHHVGQILLIDLGSPSDARRSDGRRHGTAFDSTLAAERWLIAGP